MAPKALVFRRVGGLPGCFAVGSMACQALLGTVVDEVAGVVGYPWRSCAGKKPENADNHEHERYKTKSVLHVIPLVTGLRSMWH